MKKNRFLIVVDMQNDFITGSLGTEEAQRIVPICEYHIKRRIKEGYNVVATMDTHDEDYLSTPEGKKLPVEHCIRNTWGWQFEERIGKLIDECIAGDCPNRCTRVMKPNFGSLELPCVITYMADGDTPESIELIGLCTDICVITNALLLKTYFPNVPIYVFVDCCAGVTPELHEAALKAMQSCQIDCI